MEHICVKGSKELEILGLCADSRFVCPGDLFIARKGSQFDGNHFIQEAVDAGASCVLTDLYDPFLPITQILHPNVSAIVPQIASRFYSHPSKSLKVVGITGTNGKTTTSSLVHHILETLKVKTGLIGSIDWIVGSHRYGANYTTPDAILCQKLLCEMVKEGCTACSMEVSSHALDQNRVQEVEFAIAAFTNLSQDHLDYHKTMENYKEAKGKLFANLSEDKWAIFNADEELIFPTKAHVMSYGIEKKADLMAQQITLSERKTTFVAVTEKERAYITTKLVGTFNVSNILAALSICHCMGIPLEDSGKALSSFPGVRGRLQRVARNIYIDYAHTPKGLEQVLKTLHAFKKGKILLVFGAGGDRDRDKRPLMGQVASRLADLTILTSDNPRSEDPMAIAEQIASGFVKTKPLIALDRKEAIAKAIDLAEKDDLILIAGKGHEKEQIFAGRVLPFDDGEIVREICKQRDGVCS